LGASAHLGGGAGGNPLDQAKVRAVRSGAHTANAAQSSDGFREPHWMRPQPPISPRERPRVTRQRPAAQPRAVCFFSDRGADLHRRHSPFPPARPPAASPGLLAASSGVFLAHAHTRRGCRLAPPAARPYTAHRRSVPPPTACRWRTSPVWPPTSRSWTWPSAAPTPPCSAGRCCWQGTTRAAAALPRRPGPAQGLDRRRSRAPP
jgi:hypothetical protein